MPEYTLYTAVLREFSQKKERQPVEREASQRSLCYARLKKKKKKKCHNFNIIEKCLVGHL